MRIAQRSTDAGRRGGCSMDPDGSLLLMMEADVDEVALLAIVALIFLWGTVGARFERADLTAPIVFTALGAGMVWLGVIDVRGRPSHSDH